MEQNRNEIDAGQTDKSKKMARGSLSEAAKK